MKPKNGGLLTLSFDEEAGMENLCMILDMKNPDTWRMLSLAGAALVLAITILVIRDGHSRFPYDTTNDSQQSFKYAHSGQAR
jgi:hypothetical protein